MEGWHWAVCAIVNLITILALAVAFASGAAAFVSAAWTLAAVFGIAIVVASFYC